MPTIKEKYERSKKIKMRKKNNSLTWKNSLMAIRLKNNPKKEYVDLYFNSMVLAVFLNYFDTLKNETIDSIIHMMYKQRSKMTQVRLRLSDNSIDPKKFVIFCFYRLVAIHPKLFPCVTWVYNRAVIEFDEWLSCEGMKDIHTWQEIHELVSGHSTGKKLIGDLNYSLPRKKSSTTNAIELLRNL